MTKLPGLTRQDDRPSVGGSNRGRVQVRNPIGDVALQPQARPVDTYSRPQAAPSGPNGLQQLAGALAQISPALTNFLDNSAAKAQKDAEDRAMRRIGGMSFQEARDAVNSGKMTEMDNPWFKAAFMKQYGERLAYERVNELSTEYETNFDKNSGDVDGLIRGRTSDDLDQYGNDPHFTGAYTKVMDGFGARAKTAQAQYKTEQVKQDTVSGVYDTFHGEATSLRSEGRSPQEIVTALRGKYEGNRSLLHVDFKEQDKEMVRLAEAFAAKGDMEMVNAILNSDRKGADGTVLGPLSANREFQADAVRITTNAERQAFDNTEKATRETRYDFLNEAQEGKLNVERFREWHKASEYVLKGFTLYLPQWRAKGWKSSSGWVKNRELWERLDAACAGKAIYWEKVLGHSGHRLNEMADTLANAAAGGGFPKGRLSIRKKHLDWFLPGP